MKRILIAFLMTTLSLSACGGSDEPAPTKTVYVQPESDAGKFGSDGEGQQSATEAEFLHDIGLYTTPELRAQSDTDLINLGRIMCDAFDNGASLEQVVEAGQANGEGLSETALITVAAASVVNFCPEHNTSGGIGT